MNREQMRTRVLDSLNDSSDDPQFWSLAEVDQMLQESQEVLAEEVEACTRTLYVAQRAGCMFYPLRGLGVEVMTPWRLWTHARQHKLWPLSMEELDSYYERWLTVTGGPEWWFLLSWDCIGIWPPPVVGGGLLEIDCYVWPSRLLEDSDEPLYPDADHDWLVRHAEMEGQLKQWDTARALELGMELYKRARDSKARSGLRLVQERFFSRDRYGFDARA